ncbi:MAG TPA: hypothetical protein VH592_24625 [Gemmataceae bacterium]|jgi:hypothetical protein
MRFHLLLPVLICGALLGISVKGAHAGSFFGPCCYGANYTYQYPNRSHNTFGCGPGCHCQAWHGFFRHRVCHKIQAMPNEATPANGTPEPVPATQPPF